MIKNDYNLIKIFENINNVSSGKLSYYISPFISLSYQMEVEKLMKGLKLNYEYFNSGERKIFIVGSFNKSMLSHLNPIDILEITSFNNLSHSDILGSILALGITRELIGNISIDKTTYLVEVDKTIMNLIIEKLEYVRHDKVRITISSKKLLEPKFEAKNVIVSSLRLDNIVSSIFNISRIDSKNAILNGDVYYNFNNEVKIDSKIKMQSYLSCRKKGKVFIDSIIGETKKDRIILSVKYYIN